MTICKHCGQPIEWDTYWTTWDHTGRDRKATAELCQPERGFRPTATVATPTPKADQ